jgi:hypothetical protein
MNTHEVYHRILIHLASQIRSCKNWPREKLVKIQLTQEILI